MLNIFENGALLTSLQRGLISCWKSATVKLQKMVGEVVEVEMVMMVMMIRFVQP